MQDPHIPRVFPPVCSPIPWTACLSYLPTALIRHHEQGKSEKKEFVAHLESQKVRVLTIIAGNMAAGRQDGVQPGAASPHIDPQAGGRERHGKGGKGRKEKVFETSEFLTILQQGHPTRPFQMVTSWGSSM